MINWFNFNGEKSTDYGLVIEKMPNIFDAPSGDVEKISIPGRNGDLLISNDRFENIPLTYSCGMKQNSERIRGIKGWLCTQGYKKLYDSYNPDYFRYATFINGFTAESDRFFSHFDISFDCKPFLYRFDGENEIPIENGMTIYNPERFESRPLIKIVRSVTTPSKITIGQSSFSVKGSGILMIDTETQNCYYEDTNRNNDISTADISINSGSSEISWTGSIDEMIIIPRWRTL